MQPVPTNLELLQLIAEKYGVDVSAYEKTTERTEFVLLRLILQALVSGGGDISFDGERPILREGLTTTGETIGGTTVKEFLENYFYPALSPLATLSIVGSSILEFTADSELSKSLNWTVTKRTNSIISINVAGVAQVPTGENQTGTQAVTVTTNETNSFSILVSDGTLSDTKNVSFTFRHGYYWGAKASIASISDAEIMALTGAGVSTGKALATSRVKSFDGINGQGNYLVFAFPVSFGVPVFKINGLVNTAYTKIREDNFINSLGYTEPYQVWASNTPQNSAIADFEIQ